MKSGWAQAATFPPAVLNIDADHTGFEDLLCRQFQLGRRFAIAGFDVGGYRCRYP
jgi:hypothetical protein